MISGIFFDYFGVLCLDRFRYLQSITPSAKVQRLYDLYKQLDYGYVVYEEYIKQVSELVERSLNEVDTIMQCQYHRNEHVIEVIRSLHPSYYMGILSNMSRSAINGLFSQKELDMLFNVIITSGEVGMVKPDSDIYRLAAFRLGVLPEECIMVDDLLVNIKGAEAVGMSGILYVDMESFEKNLSSALKDQSA